MSPKAKPARAPYGSVRGRAVLVRCPDALADAATKAARTEGVSEAEWWRRAALERLERQSRRTS